jgi:hypothetical protein
MGVVPATRRGANGFCKKIRCFKKCLPATARIATPRGPVPVSQLRRGDVVWTPNALGKRVAAPIAIMVARPISGSHSLVELSLADGRVVRASVGHPDRRGRDLASYQPGDELDGSAVVQARRVDYTGDHTWDLLPAGPSGAYWADDVLMGSTLNPIP